MSMGTRGDVRLVDGDADALKRPFPAIAAVVHRTGERLICLAPS